MFDGLPRNLRDMATDPACAMEIGRASEHLVVADLITQGYRAFLTEQGLPYDVVADIDNRLIRIQVKAACFARNVNTQGRSERIAYSWFVRRRGKDGTKRLTDSDCDIVALVALDVRRVAYAPVTACGGTVTLHLEPEPGRFGYTISELEQFGNALRGKPRGLATHGRRAEIKRNGQLSLLVGGKVG